MVPKPLAKKVASTSGPSKTKEKVPDPAAVDAWLAKLPDDARAALERVRAQIREAAPEAVETIAWNVPMYYAGTTPLLGINAFKSHLSLGVGAATFEALRDELEGYDTSKGTLRFTPDAPPPASLVTKIVLTRLAQHALGRGG